MTIDYSLYDCPVEPDSIPYPAQVNFVLQPEDLALFADCGFVIGRGRLSANILSVLKLDLDDLLVPGHDGNELWYEYNVDESLDADTTLFHALGAWRLRKSFHDLLWHPAITVPARQLLGSRIRFWHDQLFCKPAQHGGVVAWHQDYSYWTRTGPMNHLTCWIALEDATIENGCLHYLSGSNHWELLPNTGLAGDMEAISTVLNEQQLRAFDNPTPVELKAGQVVFHHPLTVHGSFDNKTAVSRKASVVNLIADGVVSLTDEPLLKGVDVIPCGEPLAGQFFPLLSE